MDIFNITGLFLILRGNDDASPSASIELQPLYIDPSHFEEILVRCVDCIWEILLSDVILVLPLCYAILSYMKFYL